MRQWELHLWKVGISSSRSFTTSHNSYVKPSSDTVFRHLMVNDEVRNSFLSAVVKDNITSLKLLSQSLNLIAHYDELAQFVHADQFKQFFKNMPQCDLV
eukprot:604609-Rhodomonas_salina.1